MATSKVSLTIDNDISADIKVLWPDKDIEIDYCTDDYLTYYVDLLELRGDPCSREGQSLIPIFCDPHGANGIEGAEERLHMAIKQSLAKKLASEADLAEGKGKQ